MVPLIAMALIVPLGCGGGVEEEPITAEEPEELVEANEAMEAYMESGGDEGSAGAQ